MPVSVHLILSLSKDAVVCEERESGRYERPNWVG
jgi:hypothetical protein